jgi:hypothetical protein
MSESPFNPSDDPLAREVPSVIGSCAHVVVRSRMVFPRDALRRTPVNSRGRPARNVGSSRIKRLAPP